jgi:hypothetical protein
VFCEVSARRFRVGLPGGLADQGGAGVPVGRDDLPRGRVVAVAQRDQRRRLELLVLGALEHPREQVDRHAVAALPQRDRAEHPQVDRRAGILDRTLDGLPVAVPRVPRQGQPGVPAGLAAGGRFEEGRQQRRGQMNLVQGSWTPRPRHCPRRSASGAGRPGGHSVEA